MQPGYPDATPEKIRGTIETLRRLREARAQGYRGHLVTDPSWLGHMAINRRAGWIEDPHFRGTAVAAPGARVPRRATGDAWRHLRQIAGEVNTPRLIVRKQRLGEWGPYLLARIPERFEEAA